MKRAIGAAGVLAVLVAGAAALWWDQRSEPPVVEASTEQAKRPNVLMVVTCTTRRDQLTPYGAPASTTPWLQRLADQGARFDDALSASAWTKESIAALLTGQHALQLNLHEPKSTPNQRVLAAEVETLAERFQSHGYHTIGLTANPNINGRFGFDQGFDSWTDSATRGFAKRNKVYAEELVDKALEQLDAAPPDKPVFVYLTVIDPHYPFTADPGEVEQAREPGLPDRVVRYRTQLTKMDRALARLDQSLSKRGWGAEDYTLVVADHGEGLSWPEHHRSQHGRVLVPSVVRIPWLVRGPGIPAGSVVEGVASGVDFSPTVAGLLGWPDTFEGDGRDWSSQLASGTPTQRDTAISDTWYYGADRTAIWTSSTQCQRDWGSKVNHDAFAEGCFDRIADPLHEKPLPGEPRLMQALQAWRDASGKVALTAADGGQAEEDGDIAEQLEALGYAQ